MRSLREEVCKYISTAPSLPLVGCPRVLRKFKDKMDESELFSVVRNDRYILFTFKTLTHKNFKNLNKYVKALQNNQHVHKCYVQQ